MAAGGRTGLVSVCKLLLFLLVILGAPGTARPARTQGKHRGKGGSRVRQEDSPPRIVEHPSDLIVSKGEPATLNCKAEGRPTPTVEWYKDGERVETDRDNPRSHRMLLPSGSLFFLRIVHGRRSKPDDGNYVCIARNYLGEAVSHNASLEVALLRDDFRQNPSDVVVAAGEPATLECQPPRGHPEPTTYWKKDKVRVSDRDERVTIRGGKLAISGTRKSDAGMYVCVATNMVGERDSEAAQLSVFERPTFLRRPVSQVVLEEEGVELRCQSEGDPPPTVRWRKDDADVSRGRYEVRYDKEESLLRIRKALAGDQGTFTCVAENRMGKAEASATLTVRAAPQFVVRPRDQIVAQGRTATFPCETKGNPQPAVFWQREGSQDLLFPSPPQQSSSRLWVSPGGNLTVSEVQRADAGVYICQALTVAGSIQARAQLEVTDALTHRPPPIIRQGPANQTAGVEGVAVLKCQASGEPPPTITWLKDGVSLLGTDPRLTLLEPGSLQIHGTRLSDSGMYTCVASSSSGETSWNAYLEVRETAEVTDSTAQDSENLPGPPSDLQVTDVTKSSISLSWQPGPEGGSPVSAYVIEAFSQLVSNSWQTVADRVKDTRYTVTGLRPNTIYLFIVRAVNAQGLGDPSAMSEPVRTQDISPPAPGVDHRHVQKELSEVIVRLHNPVVLSPTSIQVTWTVDHQSQFIQGYRVLYRQTSGLPSPGAWQSEDLRVPSERSLVLSGLKKGVVYEIKARPYFNEFQGVDSESLTARTTEDAPSAPPQQITVLTVGSHNSTSISVSWDPPPPDHQNGIIQEYKIWCLANETRFHVNTTVDAAIRSVVVGGLQAGVQYRVEVAASTSAGVGVKSEALPIIIGKEVRDGMADAEGASSLSDVLRQPAFIAGLGGACWIILMGFSAWLYWRRKKRKGLSNYAVQSFTFTRAVTFQRGDRTLLGNGRPGLLKAGDPRLPWLGDSWPSTSLPVSSSARGNKSVANFGRGDVLPVGGHREKTGTMLSDGAIYSSIDFSGKAAYRIPGGAGQVATPYATTQILQSASFQELGVAPPDPRWKASLQPPQQDRGTLGYTLSDAPCSNTLLFTSDYRLAEGFSGRIPHNQSQDFSSCGSFSSSDRTLSDGKGKKKKMKSKGPRNGGSCWASVPLPPPPMHPLPGTELDHCAPQHHDGGGYQTDSWGASMPLQTYLHQGLGDELEEEDEEEGHVPAPPLRGVALSAASLSPSPHEETQSMLQARLDELTRAYQLDVANQTWHMQATPHSVRTPGGYAPATLLSELETSMRNGEEEEGRDEQEAEEDDDEGYEILSHLRNMQHGPATGLDSQEVPAAGKGISQRPRPGSTGTAGMHSLGHQRVAHPSLHMGAQLDLGGTEPRQRNGHADGLPSPPAPPPWDVEPQDTLDKWGQRPSQGEYGGSLPRGGQFSQQGPAVRWPPHRTGADQYCGEL
ncbi:roundabout homolog 2-like isoform X4 [Anguilla rostrata]|uniref:roundabout homolog 2-like isoform X4 n=1 Tax=Anguilla rostrata TaxID=7938 RepID=UPI0030CB10A6